MYEYKLEEKKKEGRVCPSQAVLKYLPGIQSSPSPMALPLSKPPLSAKVMGSRSLHFVVPLFLSSPPFTCFITHLTYSLFSLSPLSFVTHNRQRHDHRDPSYEPDFTHVPHIAASCSFFAILTRINSLSNPYSTVKTFSLARAIKVDKSNLLDLKSACDDALKEVPTIFLSHSHQPLPLIDIVTIPYKD